MRHLIYGIDPGITSAICALDLNGKLVAVHSAKKFGLDSITSFITRTGQPVAFACDVANPPLLLKKLSAVFNVRLVSPKEDMRVGEKQLIISETFPEEKRIDDDHKRDATAAAVSAYRKFYPLFDKIDFILKREGLQEKSEEVKKKLLMGEAETIKDALREKPEEIMLQGKKRQKILNVPSRLSLLKQDNKVQRELIDRLKKENQKLWDKLEYLKHRVGGSEELQRLAESRKITIGSLETQIAKLKQNIAGLEKDVQKKTKELILAKQEEYVKVTRLKDLGFEEVSRLAEENFKDCLLVSNLNVPSSEIKERLKSLNITAIIYESGAKAMIKELSRGFLVIGRNEIAFEEKDGVLVVPKPELERLAEKAKVTSVERLIEEHRSRF
jgi:hypothetical protein